MASSHAHDAATAHHAPIAASRGASHVEAAVADGATAAPTQRPPPPGVNPPAGPPPQRTVESASQAADPTEAGRRFGAQQHVAVSAQAPAELCVVPSDTQGAVAAATAAPSELSLPAICELCGKSSFGKRQVQDRAFSKGQTRAWIQVSKNKDGKLPICTHCAWTVGKHRKGTTTSAQKIAKFLDLGCVDKVKCPRTECGAWIDGDTCRQQRNFVCGCGWQGGTSSTPARKNPPPEPVVLPTQLVPSLPPSPPMEPLSQPNVLEPPVDTVVPLRRNRVRSGPEEFLSGLWSPQSSLLPELDSDLDFDMDFDLTPSALPRLDEYEEEAEQQQQQHQGDSSRHTAAEVKMETAMEMSPFLSAVLPVPPLDQDKENLALPSPPPQPPHSHSPRALALLPVVLPVAAAAAAPPAPTQEAKAMAVAAAVFEREAALQPTLSNKLFAALVRERLQRARPRAGSLIPSTSSRPSPATTRRRCGSISTSSSTSGSSTSGTS
jgi:hypothetical protein